MTRTQIQLPDELYRRAKALAADREISLAELVRNGLEYMLTALTPPNAERADEALPVLDSLPETPDFEYPEWRPDAAWADAAETKPALDGAKPKKKGGRA